MINVSHLARIQSPDLKMNSLIIKKESELSLYFEKRNLFFSDEDFNRENQSLKELKKKNYLPYIFDIIHLSEISNVSHSKILFFICNKKKVYASFKILKKNGKYRHIDAPYKPLKDLQRWILDNMSCKTALEIDPGYRT